MLESFVEAVAGLEVAMSHEAMVEFFRACDRLDARRAVIVAEFEASQQWAVVGSVSLQQWLTSHGRMSQRDAAGLRARARVCSSFPVTADAYGSGDVSPAQVQIIARNVPRAHQDAFTAAEGELVPTLIGLDHETTARVMTCWKQHANPDGSEPDGGERSEMHLSPVGGRYRADADLTAEDGEIWNTAATLAMTDDVDGEPKRSMAQRRADAVTSILRRYLDHPERPTPARRRPHLLAEISLHELEERRGGRFTDGTPLDPQTVQRLLCDSEITRILRAPSGIIDYGRTTRTIPTGLRRVVTHRDRHCRYPGCDRPAHWCEVHHHIPWEHHGCTNLSNLVLLCTRHHHLLHDPNWKSTLDADGTLTVTTPDGHTLQTHPPP